MKVVVAVDSFKGSMTSLEAGEAVKRGVLRAMSADVKVFPLADGGEGTSQALTDGLGGAYRCVDVTGPMGNMVSARYGMLDGGRVAVMEMAEAAGITLVNAGNLDPINAVTTGVGEMILDAVQAGCRDFILGIGGSATTECGIGMLGALGYEFFDSDGNSLPPVLNSLAKVDSISGANVPEELRACRFRVACDVTNPLCGKTGAVRIFGRQKGVKDEDMGWIDAAMAHFATVTARFSGKDCVDMPGAGAAGGLGFSLISYLPGAELKSGISIVMDASGIEKSLADADIVVTGEGRLDGQTAMGKAPVGVARLAKKHGCKVIAFAGGVTEDAAKCNDEGIDAYFPIVRGAVSLDEAMVTENAVHNMELAAEQTFRLIAAYI